MKSLLMLGLLLLSVNSFAGQCDEFLYNWDCRNVKDQRETLEFRLVRQKGVVEHQIDGNEYLTATLDNNAREIYTPDPNQKIGNVGAMLCVDHERIKMIIQIQVKDKTNTTKRQYTQDLWLKGMNTITVNRQLIESKIKNDGSEVPTLSEDTSYSCERHSDIQLIRN